MIERSNAEDVKVAMDQDVGFMAGSKPRYDLRKNGVMLESKVGIVEVSTVMGMR